MPFLPPGGDPYHQHIFRSFSAHEAVFFILMFPGHVPPTTTSQFTKPLRKKKQIVLDHLYLHSGFHLHRRLENGPGLKM